MNVFELIEELVEGNGPSPQLKAARESERTCRELHQKWMAEGGRLIKDREVARRFLSGLDRGLENLRDYMMDLGDV